MAPPFVRRVGSLDVAIPWLLLRGVSTGNMRAVVSALVGEETARGSPPNVVSRLKLAWWDGYRTWKERPLDDDWMCLWADGIHSGLRGDGGRLRALVVIGANARLEEHFPALEGGVRELAQSWRELLLGQERRGLRKPPKLAVGDGAPGFWSALLQVYPETPGQCCRVHKTSNVLKNLPKSSQAKAKEGLHQIWMAETREQAESDFGHWSAQYRDKYPKDADCPPKDREALSAF